MGLLIANFDLTTVDRGQRGFWTSGWPIAAALVACAGLRFVAREWFGFTGVALVFGAAVWHLVRRPGASPLGAIPFYWLSRLSYGMYLNHSYFAKPLIRLGLGAIPGAGAMPTLHNIAVLGLVTATSVVLALATYCAIEHPFLRWRHALLDREPAGRLACPSRREPLLAAGSTLPVSRSPSGEAVS